MKDLYKILSGKIVVKIDGSIVTIGPFSFDDYYAAEIYAEEVYLREFEGNSLTESEAIDIITDLGEWSIEDEEKLKKIPKNIDQMKVDYFHQFHLTSIKESIRYNINLQYDTLSSLLTRKNYLLSKTCEYARDQARIYHLIENCSYCEGERVNFNKFPINKLLLKYQEEILTDEEIRQIAKCGEFRVLWSAHKEEICRQPISSMKTSLINWARVYDSVYESTECPSDAVIDDDIALDGWFISRRRKREDERKKNGNVNEKMKNAGEVFLNAKTQEDVQSIYNMNSAEGQRKIKLLEKDLKNNSSIDEGKLSSNTEELGMFKNQMAKKALRR